MISKPSGFKINQKEREKTKARSKTEKANLKQKDKSANDITQIILRIDLLSQIIGSTNPQGARTHNRSKQFVIKLGK